MLGVFLLALVARLAVIAFVGFDRISFGDARSYLFAASELARTGHYPTETDPALRLFRPPGYPAFVVLATLGSPSRTARAKAAGALLGALSCVVLVALSLRLFGRPAVAIATGIAGAVDPSLVWICADIQSEPLFLLLLATAGLCLLAAVDRPSSGVALLAGALLAGASLTRPTALALVPFLGAPLFDRRYPLRARVHLAASAGAGFFVVLAPWTIRNAVTFHELLLVNDGGGIVLYQGNDRAIERFYEVRDAAGLDRWIALEQQEIRKAIAGLPDGVREDPARRSRALAALAITERLRDPADTLSLYAHKTLDWLRLGPNTLVWPAGPSRAVGAIYGAGALLAVLGLVRAPRPGVRTFILLFLVVTMAVHILTLVAWRYRTPYWGPVGVLYGVFGAFDAPGMKWIQPS
jgi:4-amino-4-deoxy-L-arabinose transferase-like glycosyltransferase